MKKFKIGFTLWRKALSSNLFYYSKNANFRIQKESTEVDLRRMRSSSVALVFPDLLCFKNYRKRATKLLSINLLNVKLDKADICQIQNQIVRTAATEVYKIFSIVLAILH